MEYKKIISKQLGQILIEKGIITEEELKKALEIQKQSGELIGRILVGLGYATEEGIAQALTVQYGFPFLSLLNYDIDSQIASIIPKNMAEQYGLIAIDKIGNTLTVAMSNPLNTSAIEDLEMLTKHKIQIFIATMTDIIDAISRAYKK